MSASELVDRALLGRDDGDDESAALVAGWMAGTHDVLDALSRLARQMGGDGGDYLSSLLVEARRPMVELAERLAYVADRINANR